MSRHRPPVLLALLVAGLLTLAACGDGETVVTGTQTADGQDSTATDAPDQATETAPESGASAEAPPPTTADTGQNPGAGQTTAAPGAAPAGACTAAGSTTTANTSGVPGGAAAKATQLHAAAVACDQAGLTSISGTDKTLLGLDGETAAQVFALPDSGSYSTLATALSLKPELNSDEWIWPRVAAQNGANDPAAWQEAVAAGLISSAQAAQDQPAGAYTGMRVSISSDGRWVAYYK
ncbi:MAG: hypothetical protein ACK5MT_11545 [Actinomycetales bacterium]